MDSQYLLRSAVREIAEKYSLPSGLVEAVIEVESGWSSHAIRYEPHYRWLWDAELNKPFKVPSNTETTPQNFPFYPLISSRETEFIGQKISWGPMQVMGAVARELGFRREFPALCGPLGIGYGCKHLANLKRRYFSDHGWGGVVSAYNAGSVRLNDDGHYVNAPYVARVERKFHFDSHGHA